MNHRLRGVAASMLLMAFGMTAATALPLRPPAAPPVFQVNRFDCGVAALATVLSLQQGHAVVPETLTTALALTEGEQAAVREQGYSLYELSRMAQAMGAQAVVQHLDASALPALPLPALVYLRLPTGPHFSVVTELAGDSVALADPSQGLMIWPKAQFLAAWAPTGSGYALTVTADPDASV